MFTYVHPCSPMFTHVHLRSPMFTYVHPCSHMFTYVQPSSPMFTYVHPMFTYVHLSSPIFTYVHPCSSTFTHVHPRSLKFTHVHPSSPTFTQVHTCSPTFTQVYPCSPTFITHNCSCTIDILCATFTNSLTSMSCNVIHKNAARFLFPYFNAQSLSSQTDRSTIYTTIPIKASGMFQYSTLFVYCRTNEILSGTDWHITERRFIDYVSHCRM